MNKNEFGMKNQNTLTPFSEKLIETIKEIPKGKVSSYGRIASLAGKPRGARQVAWFLHSSSRKHRLPWHRVVNSSGKIVLPEPAFSRQRRLLRKEGVEVSLNGKIDMKAYLWRPGDQINI